MLRVMSSAASSSSARARLAAAVSSSVGSAEQPATSLRSAEPPATPSTSGASAERAPSRSTPHLTSSDEQPGPDESGEEEPKKRCKHDQLVVSEKM